MKKEIKPTPPAEGDLWSDATGEKFPLGIAPVELTLSFGYGSQYDGADIVLHFNDEEIDPLLDLLEDKLSQKSREEMKRILGERTLKPTGNTVTLKEFLKGAGY